MDVSSVLGFTVFLDRLFESTDAFCSFVSSDSVFLDFPAFLDLDFPGNDDNDDDGDDGDGGGGDNGGNDGVCSF
jgi:hypothetical protein